MKDKGLLEFEALTASLRSKYESLRPGSKQQKAFLMHLASLTRAYSEPMDYPTFKGESFPVNLSVAQAVCHPECGTNELIVDGSTQECQNCGGTMFRTAVASYKLTKSVAAPKVKR